MLHILNGEATADIFSQTELPGERFSFRDALINGPAPAGVAGPDWRRLRAAHLASAYQVDVQKTERDLANQEDVFASALAHDEVVLWFESDLFCQTNMLYVLDWFARRELESTALSLICIGEFPGKPNFRGLGELNPDELASLFAERQQITQAEFDLATKAWEAYGSPDPNAIKSLIESDTSALPFLHTAFALHLQRFPSVFNGLGRIENRGLELAASGHTRFVDLFPRFIDSDSGYGLGDAQFWNALQRLTSGPQPFLINGNGQGGADDKMRHSTFEITAAGREALSGKVDFIELNGIDDWLGGVHLQDVNLWRWNGQTKELVGDARDG